MPEEITPEELERKRRNGTDVQVVDIREEETFAGGHIPGSENLPLSEFADRVEDVDWPNGDDDLLVVACYVGESSVQAARLLEAYDGTGEATVATMVGGYEDYEGELESETG